MNAKPIAISNAHPADRKSEFPADAEKLKSAARNVPINSSKRHKKRTDIIRPFFHLLKTLSPPI